jgi:hypothetical protein
VAPAWALPPVLARCFPALARCFPVLAESYRVKEQAQALARCPHRRRVQSLAPLWLFAPDDLWRWPIAVG